MHPPVDIAMENHHEDVVEIIELKVEHVPIGWWFGAFLMSP